MPFGSSAMNYAIKGISALGGGGLRRTGQVAGIGAGIGAAYGGYQGYNRGTGVMSGAMGGAFRGAAMGLGARGAARYGFAGANALANRSAAFGRLGAAKRYGDYAMYGASSFGRGAFGQMRGDFMSMKNQFGPRLKSSVGNGFSTLKTKMGL
jgi:hypothetical protein